MLGTLLRPAPRRKIAPELPLDLNEAPADAVLRQELRSFSHDALIELEEDLRVPGRVIRKAWVLDENGTRRGCVLAYRIAGSGSFVTRDLKGEFNNDFTRAWDNCRVDEAWVLARVRHEMDRRDLRRN